MSALTVCRRSGALLGYHPLVRQLLLVVVVAVGAVLLAACAPALSTFTPAPVSPQGHFRGATAIGVSIPTGPLSDFVDRAEDLSKAAVEGRDLTDEEVGDLFESTTGLLLNLPSVAFELQGRYGIAKRVDLGLRLALPGAIRLDGRYQFIKNQGRAFAASVGLGLTYYSLEIPVPPPIDEVITVDDFTRFELDVPLLFGWSNEIGHVWFGPKLVLSTYSVAMSADLGAEVELASVSGTAVYYGLQIGGAIGYKYVWVSAELTIAGMSGSADVELQALGVTLKPSFSGAVIYPAFGLIFQF